MNIEYNLIDYTAGGAVDPAMDPAAGAADAPEAGGASRALEAHCLGLAEAWGNAAGRMRPEMAARRRPVRRELAPVMNAAIGGPGI